MSKDVGPAWTQWADQTVTYGEALDLSNALWDKANAMSSLKDINWALVAAHEAGKMDMLRIILRAEVEGLDMDWARNWEYLGANDFINDRLTEEES
jgi:hypothetical protein